MKKTLTFITIILSIVLFIVPISAIESTDTKPIIEPEIVTSSDSVPCDVFYEVGYDALTESIYLDLAVDTLGVCVYDNPETTFIDGIRLNGETVNSLRIPIDPYVPNKIVVKTTYKEDFTGTLAQISDGTYDYANLLTNPIMLVQIIYYALAVISVIVGIVAALKNKNKQVKTAEEIASTVDTHTIEAYNTLTANFKNETTNTLVPFMQTISKTQEAMIEAIVLMNSKDPNTHLEALECLKKVASTDMSKVIGDVKTELNKIIEDSKIKKEQELQTLTAIAETAQEVSANENIPELPIF